MLEDFSDELAQHRLGVALNNYGIMLIKQNRFDEAKKVLLHSRDIRLKSDPYGVKCTDESLYKLALCEGKYEDAYTYLKEILEIQEKYGVMECNMLNEFTNYTDVFVQICLEINKIKEAQLAYKKIYDLICNIPKENMTEEMYENKKTITERIISIFKTTDFLK